MFLMLSDVDTYADESPRACADCGTATLRAVEWSWADGGRYWEPLCASCTDAKADRLGPSEEEWAQHTAEELRWMQEIEGEERAEIEERRAREAHRNEPWWMWGS